MGSIHHPLILNSTATPSPLRYSLSAPRKPRLSRPRHDTPNPDHLIRISSKQRLPIRAPTETDRLRLPRLLAHGPLVHVRLQLVHLALLLQVEDDDVARGRRAQPVSVRREYERVDLVAGGQRIKVFGFVQVPEHRCAVFAAGGAEGAVRGDGHGVDVACVADVVGLNPAGG